MNASGGAAAPLNVASEEFGINAPRHEQVEDERTSTSASGPSASSNTNSGGSGSSGANKGSHQTSGNAKSSHDTHGSHKQEGKHDLESISREKAERYVNLDEEDVQHAGSANKSSDGAQRSSQRAPKDVGSKEDIKQLHGKAASLGNNNGEAKGISGSGKSEHHKDHKSGKHSSEHQSGGKGDSQLGGDSSLESMRHTAEKFVNLEE